MQIDVSFAVACFNAGEYLESAVRSALAQRDVTVEVLIVDDGSTDDSQVIAARLAEEDPRVFALRTPCNSGPGGARNIAINAMRGDWYAVLDADDLLLPARSQKLMTIAAQLGCDMVADNLIEFGDGIEERLMFDIAAPDSSTKISLYSYLSKSILFGGEASPGFLKPMVRRDAIKRIGLRYNPELRIGEDDEFVIRAMSAGVEYGIAGFAGYRYRKHEGSISHRLSLANIEKMINAEAEIAAYLPKDVAGSSVYRKRIAALQQARAFTQSIEALKQRSVFAAILAIAKWPTALKLYAMPLKARFARLLGSLKRLSAD